MPPGPGHAPGDHGASRLFAVDLATGMMGKLYAKVSGLMPAFSHAISVSIRGGPEADLRRIWYLCLAAAFGRYRNRVLGVQQVHLDATWDITGKACSVTIGYVNNGFIDRLSEFTSESKVFPIEGSALGFLQRGPDQVTIGGNWPDFALTLTQQSFSVFGVRVRGGALAAGRAFVGTAAEIAKLLKLQSDVSRINTNPLAGDNWAVVIGTCGTAPLLLQVFAGSGSQQPDVFRELPRINGALTYLPWRRVWPNGQLGLIGLGSTQSLRIAPNLPDDGRLITTGEKLDPRVQHPRPQIDGVGRSSTMALVSQALNQPCFIAAAPPCPVIPLGSPGLRVYPAGQGDDTLGLNDEKIVRAIAKDRDYNTLAAKVGRFFRRSKSRDGYPTLPTFMPDLRD